MSNYQYFKKSGLIATEINVLNYSNEIELVKPMEMIPVGYSIDNIVTNIRYDLRAEVKLTNGIALSAVPPINPEDSDYRRYSKLQIATENSEKMTVEFNSSKHGIVIRSLDFFNFGGVWRENLIDAEHIDLDDIISITTSGDSPSSGDYIRLVGNYIAESYVSNQTTQVRTAAPVNFGAELNTTTPTLIVPENPNRARLTLVNVGFTDAYIAFGDAATAADALATRNCLILPAKATWNDSASNSIVIKSEIWGEAIGTSDIEGNELLTTEVTGVELSYV